MSQQDGQDDLENSAEASAARMDGLLKSVIRLQMARLSSSVKVTPGVSEEVESETYRKAFADNEGQKHRHREIITPALRNIAQAWIIAVILILIWQGFGSKIGFFHLSDSVLITLLTTTTVNILGLFLLALKYLYANPEFKSPRAHNARSPSKD